MDLAHLRIIHALQQHQTLAAAAESLHLTQSALSHRMKALEQELGVAFWDKRGQRLVLTPAGQELLRLAQRVLPEVEAGRDRLKRMAQGQGGRLHIAVECLPCAQWLNPALASFMQAWPELEVDVVSEYRFAAFPALLDYQVDACLTPDPIPHPRLHRVVLFRYPLCLVVGRQHRLAAQAAFQANDLTAETLLTYPVERSRLDVFTQILQPAGVEPRQHKTVGDTDLLLGMVAAGRGVSLLPQWLVERSPYAPSLHWLSPPIPLQKELCLVVRSEDASKPWLQALTGLLCS